MSRPYADTAVSIERSQEQIRQLLKGFGVKAIRFTSFPSYALLEFVREVEKRKLVPYRIRVLPQIQQDTRSVARELDRAERQVWRVVWWWLKAKFEAISFGLVEFEEELLPYMLVADSNGRTATVAQALGKRLTGMVGPSADDPFGGLRPALPSGQEKGGS